MVHADLARFALQISEYRKNGFRQLSSEPSRRSLAAKLERFFRIWQAFFLHSELIWRDLRRAGSIRSCNTLRGSSVDRRRCCWPCRPLCSERSFFASRHFRLQFSPMTLFGAASLRLPPRVVCLKLAHIPGVRCDMQLLSSILDSTQKRLPDERVDVVFYVRIFCSFSSLAEQY